MITLRNMRLDEMASYPAIWIQYAQNDPILRQATAPYEFTDQKYQVGLTLANDYSTAYTKHQDEINLMKANSIVLKEQYNSARRKFSRFLKIIRSDMSKNIPLLVELGIRGGLSTSTETLIYSAREIMAKLKSEKYFPQLSHLLISHENIDRFQEPFNLLEASFTRQKAYHTDIRLLKSRRDQAREKLEQWLKNLQAICKAEVPDAYMPVLEKIGVHVPTNPTITTDNRNSEGNSEGSNANGNNNTNSEDNGTDGTEIQSIPDPSTLPQDNGDEYELVA